MTYVCAPNISNIRFQGSPQFNLYNPSECTVLFLVARLDKSHRKPWRWRWWVGGWKLPPTHIYIYIYVCVCFSISNIIYTTPWVVSCLQKTKQITKIDLRIEPSPKMEPSNLLFSTIDRYRALLSGNHQVLCWHVKFYYGYVLRCGLKWF